jgi:hypothetical protein
MVISVLSLQLDVTFVASIPALLPLGELVNLPVESPSQYVDLGGINLSRHGSTSIVSLYLRPSKKVYLVDIYTLGSIAFSTVHNRISLKCILEPATILKVFFDIRNDSDALFSHYEILVDGIEGNATHATCNNERHQLSQRRKFWVSAVSFTPAGLTDTQATLINLSITSATRPGTSIMSGLLPRITWVRNCGDATSDGHNPAQNPFNPSIST